jgi:transcriptional regulator with GAF, ATPase, and Fis domain
MANVLVTWCGATDLKAARGEGVGLGPVAHALSSRTFEEVVLLTNYEKRDMDIFVGWLEERTKVPIAVCFEKLRSPTHFGDIYKAVAKTVDRVRERSPKSRLTFHLSPGTPAMAAVWILTAPRYDAELIQSSQQAGVETVTLPFEIAAEFVPGLVRQGDAELERLADAGRPEDPSFKDLIHRSDAVKQLLERAAQAAPYGAPLLIEGESGTGKELLAAAVHKASGRKGRFVPVNCGAIPKDLVESVFFGHVKGTFTGANFDREGAFEAADGGTLFLDEVGELPLDAQVKLLRALQGKKIQRIGTTTEISVDVRIVAATNRDLLVEVAAGRFREDLYFRLAVLLLRSPPLREREGDLSLLINTLLEKLNAERPARERRKLTPGGRNILLRHSWPGNVRELQATLLRAFVWAKGTTIDEATVRESLLVRPEINKDDDILHRPLGEGFRLQSVLGEVVRHYLSRALEEAHGNKTQAASLAGFANYQTLTNWARKYGVDL